MLNTYVAGGVAQELAHGIPIETNEGMTSDLEHLHKIGNTMGFTPEETQGMIDGSIAQTKEMLNHPATLDIIKNAAAVREEGLSKTLHASAGKVQDVIRQVREARANEGNKNQSANAVLDTPVLHGDNQGAGETNAGRDCSAP